MRIAYLSIDAVNSSLAMEMAERHGINLCVVEPRDGKPGPQFDAVLCDWDFWHARTRPLALRISWQEARGTYHSRSGDARCCGRRG